MLPRERNIQIYLDNERLLAQGDYPSKATSTYYNLPDLAKLPSAFPIQQVHTAVTGEDTISAGQRLTLAHPQAQVALLNFASALHAGGGYIRGATAQEECLCRCSDLYRELQKFPAYYAAHQSSDARYSDRVILNEGITVFRDVHYQLTQPWQTHVITVAAPNQIPGPILNVDEIFRQRMAKLFRVLASRQYTHLVLGAWGCGAFRNDPQLVAESFRTVLAESPWFQEVLFAVYDPSPEQNNLRSFQQVFVG
jgi:uncharacterized protein (TIGR02452 family)